MRVYAVVEGQTEEGVVKDVLAPHLASMGVFLTPIIVRTSPGHRGGGSSWKKWENDTWRILRQQKDPGVRVTTMFDLYRLPKDFPELELYDRIPDTNRRCDALEAAMAKVFDDRRFIPYLQRHEVEALVLAGLDSLVRLFDAPKALDGIARLKEDLGEQCPEDVDDGPATAPSKRLERYIPGYRKALHGPMAVEDTGLAALRKRCPRFHRWIETLEALSPERGT